MDATKRIEQRGLPGRGQKGQSREVRSHYTPANRGNLAADFRRNLDALRESVVESSRDRQQDLKRAGVRCLIDPIPATTVPWYSQPGHLSDLRKASGDGTGGFDPGRF
jgi:hypothetical protein